MNIRPWIPWAIGAGAVGAILTISRIVNAAPSCTYIPASLRGGTRRRTPRYIVIHSTESEGTALSIANYFASPSAGGSTQIIVGEDGCYRAVPDDVIPAGAPPLNEDGLHIEFVGRAAWDRNAWLRRRRTLELGRRMIRSWSSRYGIPRRLLSVGELQRSFATGGKGVTTHGNASEAFRKSTHWDPGRGFPFDLVL